MNVILSKGTLKRIDRIKELRKCSTEEAIEYSVSVGWYAAENRAKKETRENNTN